MAGRTRFDMLQQNKVRLKYAEVLIVKMCQIWHTFYLNNTDDDIILR